MTPLPLSPEYYPFIISQQPWKMNTRLQRPIVLQQTGSWYALFNEVNYIIAGINLAAVHSTKSLLTCKSATHFDAHLISTLWMDPLGRGSGVTQLCWHHVGCQHQGHALCMLMVKVKAVLVAGVARACLQSSCTCAASCKGILPGVG